MARRARTLPVAAVMGRVGPSDPPPPPTIPGRGGTGRWLVRAVRAGTAARDSSYRVTHWWPPSRGWCWRRRRTTRCRTHGRPAHRGGAPVPGSSGRSPGAAAVPRRSGAGWRTRDSARSQGRPQPVGSGDVCGGEGDTPLGRDGRKVFRQRRRDTLLGRMCRPVTRDELLARVSIDPAVCGGKPCIRGTRIWVSLLLDMMAAGTAQAELVQEYPQLTTDDLRAALAYGADLARDRFVSWASGPVAASGR